MLTINILLVWSGKKWDRKGGIAGERQTKVFMRMYTVSFVMWGICMAWLNSSLHTFVNSGGTFPLQSQRLGSLHSLSLC